MQFVDNNEIGHAGLNGSSLVVTWVNGFEFLFHPLWLRESSTHPDYRDRGTQMRIPPAYKLPLDIAVSNFKLTKSGIHVLFSDGHMCQFTSSHLLSAARFKRPKHIQKNSALWDGSFQDFKRFPYTQLQQNQQVLLEAMDAVSEFGFAYIEDIPLDLDELEVFARLVGPPRETNWGTITDVKNIPNPYDLTVTSRSLWPHVDNPYRFPAPGYIFMHCIHNDSVGGESTIVDGFNAAVSLMKSDPKAFDALTTIAPNFRHIEANALLEDYGPMIELDEDGDVVRVRFSNRTEQIPTYNHDTLNRYYYGREKFSRLIFSEKMTLETKLKPGDGFIWDNFRILHGRKEFDTNTGDRYMRHCYLDRDTFSSKHKCLKKMV